MDVLCSVLNWLDKVFLQNPGGWAAVIAAVTGYKLKDAAMLWLKSRYFIRRAIETEKAYIVAIQFADAMLMISNPFLIKDESDDFFNVRLEKAKPHIEEMYKRSLLARLYLPDDLWKQYEELRNLWPKLLSSYRNWQMYKSWSPDGTNELVKHFNDFCGTETQENFKKFQSKITELSRPIVNFDPKVMKM
jgi:hypothetical protein